MENSKQEPDQIPPKPHEKYRTKLKAVAAKISNYLGTAFYFVALSLVAVSIWGTCCTIAIEGWNNNTAAWIQAAGSIAAILGAAWLAQAELRRAKSVRIAQFDDTAGYVRFVISQAQFESHGIALDLSVTAAVTPDDVAGWRQRAETAAIGLTALIGRSDYGHASIAHMIANAKVLVDGLVASLKDLADVVAASEQPTARLRNNVVSPHRALSELLNQFDARLVLVRQTLYA